MLFQGLGLLWGRDFFGQGDTGPLNKQRLPCGRTLSRGLSVRRPHGNYGGAGPVHGRLSLGAVISSRNVGSL